MDEAKIRAAAERVMTQAEGGRIVEAVVRSLDTPNSGWKAGGSVNRQYVSRETRGVSYIVFWDGTIRVGRQADVSVRYTEIDGGPTVSGAVRRVWQSQQPAGMPADTILAGLDVGPPTSPTEPMGGQRRLARWLVVGVVAVLALWAAVALWALL